MKKTVYFENLDGLRFFCFLSVFLYHSFYTTSTEIKSNGWYGFVKYDLFGNGNLGVNFFFVLSGFLITYLLIEEKKLNAKINIPRFWLRRVLRIWPLFYACVFIGFVVFPWMKSYFGGMPDENASPWHYLFFLNNFDIINKGLPDASILSVLWSIAVEEQFYLIWPVILSVVPFKRYWIVFSLIIIGSILFRACYDDYSMHELHTFSCMGDLAIGAMGAWLIERFDTIKQYFVSLRTWQILTAYALLLGVYFFRDEVFTPYYITRIFDRLLIALIMLVVILEQNYANNSIFKFSRSRSFSKLGEITYGLYCLQFVGILIVTTLTRKLQWQTALWQVLFLETILALIVTIGFSAASFAYFEKPFLRLKEKLGYITRRAG